LPLPSADPKENIYAEICVICAIRGKLYLPQQTQHILALSPKVHKVYSFRA